MNVGAIHCPEPMQLGGEVVVGPAGQQDARVPLTARESPSPRTENPPRHGPAAERGGIRPAADEQHPRVHGTTCTDRILW